MLDKVHFISGLGADERVFKYLELPMIEPVYIRWIDPLSNESISQYAARLLPQIDQSQPVILVGMSFGGLIAQEIARIISCSKIMLIASVTSPKEYGIGLKVVGCLKLYKLFPLHWIKAMPIAVASYFFGTETREQEELLGKIIKATDPKFLKWAVQQLMTWQHQSIDDNVVRVHGSKDRIFPIPHAPKEDMHIIKGGHFIIVGQSVEVSNWIFKELKSL